MAVQIVIVLACAVLGKFRKFLWLHIFHIVKHDFPDGQGFAARLCQPLRCIGKNLVESLARASVESPFACAMAMSLASS
jgi:hypothetical protein